MLAALQRIDVFSVFKSIDNSAIRRAGAWAAAALVAVVAAIFAIAGDLGSRRMQLAIPDRPEAARATAVVAQIPPGQPELEKLTRKLDDTVKLLTAERERLSDRIASLERSVDDVTGSIKKTIAEPVSPPPDRQAAAPASAPLVPPAMIFTAVPPLPLDSPAAWPATPPATIVASPPPASARADAERSGEPVVPLPPMRADREATSSIADPDNLDPRGANDILGVDIGGARSIDALTIHWSALKVKFGEQLNDLIPVVSIRERRPGVPELRLIAGPIAGVEAATKLCMTMVAARAPCRPTQFAGQRLTQR